MINDNHIMSNKYLVCMLYYCVSYLRDWQNHLDIVLVDIQSVSEPGGGGVAGLGRPAGVGREEGGVGVLVPHVPHQPSPLPQLGLLPLHHEQPVEYLLWPENSKVQTRVCQTN